MKDVPFRLDEAFGATYWQRITAGFRDAIRSGYYQAGDRLPSIMSLADTLGVSHIVVRRAVKELKKEGLVTARRGRGIAVRGNRQMWAGHVLFVYWETLTAYHFARFAEVLLGRLEVANVAVTLCPANDAERDAGYPQLCGILERQPVNVAMLFGGNHGLDAVLTRREIPLVQVHSQSLSPTAARLFRYGDEKQWYADLVSHCREAGIECLEVVATRTDNGSLHAEISARGLPCTALPATPSDALPCVQRMEAAGYETIANRLKRPGPLPEALLFMDDWLARGGLTALLAAGVRIPEQMQVITLTNAGWTPIFPVPLTRLEYDPATAGEQVAGAVLEIIENPSAHGPLVDFNRRLIPGATTRRQ